MHQLTLPDWWPRYIQALGMPELKDDPRFQNIFSAEGGQQFDAIWYDWLADHTRAELLEIFMEARLASVPVNSPKDLLEYHHLKDRGYFVDVDHPKTGRVTYPGAPFKMSETPWQISRAPLLGEHNEDIYCQRLGYTKEDLVRLRQREVI